MSARKPTSPFILISSLNTNVIEDLFGQIPKIEEKCYKRITSATIQRSCAFLRKKHVKESASISKQRKNDFCNDQVYSWLSLCISIFLTLGIQIRLGSYRKFWQKMQDKLMQSDCYLIFPLLSKRISSHASFSIVKSRLQKNKTFQKKFW